MRLLAKLGRVNFGLDHGMRSLDQAFRRQVTRTQRRSDGTLTIDGVRFELPNRFRHWRQVTVRYAHWNLRDVHLVDPRSDTLLTAIYPLDKARNADGRRRVLTFDTASYLTVVLCGDARLTQLFRHEDLVALASRIRTRLVMDYATRQQLLTMLKHVITQAGNANLMTDPLMQTLAEHAAGNHRLLMTMAGELLVEGLQRQQAQLDEKLYLEVFQVPANTSEGKRHPVAQAAITP